VLYPLSYGGVYRVLPCYIAATLDRKKRCDDTTTLKAKVAGCLSNREPSKGIANAEDGFYS
jgi:hypothetical protein